MKFNERFVLIFHLNRLKCLAVVGEMTAVLKQWFDVCLHSLHTFIGGLVINLARLVSPFGSSKHFIIPADGAPLPFTAGSRINCQSTKLKKEKKKCPFNFFRMRCANRPVLHSQRVSTEKKQQQFYAARLISYPFGPFTYFYSFTVPAISSHLCYAPCASNNNNKKAVIWLYSAEGALWLRRRSHCDSFFENEKANLFKAG